MMEQESGEYSQQFLISAIMNTQQDLCEGNTHSTFALVSALERALCNKNGLFDPRDVLSLPDNKLREFLNTQPERYLSTPLYIYPSKASTSNGITPLVVDEGEGGRGVIFFSCIQEAIVYCLAILSPFCFLTDGPATPAESRERFIVGARRIIKEERVCGLNIITSIEDWEV